MGMDCTRHLHASVQGSTRRASVLREASEVEAPAAEAKADSDQAHLGLGCSVEKGWALAAPTGRARGAEQRLQPC